MVFRYKSKAKPGDITWEIIQNIPVEKWMLVDKNTWFVLFTSLSGRSYWKEVPDDKVPAQVKAYFLLVGHQNEISPSEGYSVSNGLI